MRTHDDNDTGPLWTRLSRNTLEWLDDFVDGRVEGGYLEALEEIIGVYRAVTVAFDECPPLRKELFYNYSLPVIRLRAALGCATELDNAVRERGLNPDADDQRRAEHESEMRQDAFGNPHE